MKGDESIMKIDKKAIVKNGLPLLAGLLSLAGMAVSQKIDGNNRNDMKEELRKEILEDLSNRIK
jgi:hypothetical protein